jgi:hypothetical protein
LRGEGCGLLGQSGAVGCGCMLATRPQTVRRGPVTGSVIGWTFRIFKLCVIDYDDCLLRAAAFISGRPGDSAGR